MSSKTAHIHGWYVTGSHRLRSQSPSGPAEVPFGRAHLRQVGSSSTACGLPALNWPIFWDLAVNTPVDMCPECRWTAALEHANARVQHDEGAR